MSVKDQLSDFHVSRLDFLRYSLATTVAVWAGSEVSGIDEAEAQELFKPAAGRQSRNALRIAGT